MRARVTAVIPVLVAGIAILGCGSGGAKSGSTPASGRKSQLPLRSRPAPAALTVTAAPIGQLPDAVQDAAVASLSDGRVVLLGGLDPADTSTDSITVLAGGAVVRRDRLPEPQHDAQAARIGRYVYVFGGGATSSFAHIVRYDPVTGTVSEVGALPRAASDVGVAALGDTAYVVGGYDGTNFLDTILAWRPGSPPRVVGRLPFGLRYAAVAADRGALIIAGGSTPTGLSNAIFSFDPTTGVVKRAGRLLVAVTHASAAAVDGWVVLVGGRRTLTGLQTAAILAVDPSSGAITRVGRLPQPLSDAAVAASANRVIVLGGENAGALQRSVLALSPRLSASG
jgi:hypothetical protein